MEGKAWQTSHDTSAFPLCWLNCPEVLQPEVLREMLGEEGPHRAFCKFCCFIMVKHVLFFDSVQLLVLLVAALHLSGFACLTNRFWIECVHFLLQICSWMHGKFSLSVFLHQDCKGLGLLVCFPPGAVNQQAVIKDVKKLLRFPVQSLIYWSISNYLAAESHSLCFSSPLWSGMEDQRRLIQRLSVLLSVSISQRHLWLFTFPLSEEDLFHSTALDPYFSIHWLLPLFPFCFQKEKKKKTRWL